MISIRARPAGPAVGDDALGPAGADEVVGLHAAGEAARQERRALLLGPQQQRLAGLGIGRPGLGVQVVAVVPDGHQTEVVHRGERRGPGAEHDPPGAAADGQEVAVAGGRPDVGGERDVVSRPEHLGERHVDACDVLDVGQAQQRAPATRAGRGGRVREEGRPVARRGRRPRPPAGHRRRAGGGGTPAPRRRAPTPTPRPRCVASSGRGRGRAPAASRRWRGGEGPRAAARRSAPRRSGRRRRRRARRPLGLSTGSGLTTRRRGVSEPRGPLRAVRATRKPSTSWPAKRTFTLTPGLACSSKTAGTA